MRVFDFKFVGKALETLVDFIFPRRCLGCRAANVLLCSPCLSTVPIHRVQCCPACRTISAFGAVCQRCRMHPIPNKGRELDGLWVISPYSQGSLVQKMIQAMKYHHGYELARLLGPWMAQQFLEGLSKVRCSNAHQFFENFEVVPVPLHASKERLRGYNQAALLAEGFARAARLPFSPFIQRILNTFPQAQLSREERLTNLKNAFFIHPDIPQSAVLNKKFVLIDDVCTTGSTLNECAALLKARGAAVVWGVVIARGG